MDEILHITTATEWHRAVEAEVLAPASLATEGFIHCCTRDQLTGVLDRFHPNRDGLVVLRLDVSQLDSELRWEAPSHPDGTPNTSVETSLRFPHIYGPIATAAVVSVEAPG